MRLAAINADSDLFRLVLSEVLVEPALSRVVAASRAAPAPTQPGAVPNGIIDEAFLGNLLYGGLMRARAALSGLPPAIATSPRIKALMAKAEQLPGNIMQNPSWWTGLVNAFKEAFTTRDGRPIKDFQTLAATLRQKVADEAGHWIQHTAERGEDQAKQTELDRTLQLGRQQAKHLHQIQKLAKRYGVSPAAFGLDPGLFSGSSGLGGLGGMRLTKKQRKALEKLVGQTRGATTMSATEAALVVAGAAGLPITEGLLSGLKSLGGRLWRALGYSGPKTSAGGLQPPAQASGQWQGQLGKLLDMLNPKRRSAIGQGFVNRSQNKLIAALAIKAAYDMARGEVARLRGGQAPPPLPSHGGKTQLAPKPAGTKTALAEPSDSDTRLSGGADTSLIPGGGTSLAPAGSGHTSFMRGAPRTKVAPKPGTRVAAKPGTRVVPKSKTRLPRPGDGRSTHMHG